MNEGINNKAIINVEDILENPTLEKIDEKRIKKNIEFLEANNLKNPEKVSFVPTSSLYKPRTPNEIIKKILVDYSLATFASYSLNDSSFLINASYEAIDKNFHLQDLLSKEDIILIKNIIEHRLSLFELKRISSLYEEVNVLMWALGFIDKINSTNECNLKLINKIIYQANGRDYLIENSVLRKKEEILENADLISRYNSMESNSIINKNVVKMQFNAFKWLISNDDKSQNVTVRLNDLGFSFRKSIDLNIYNNGLFSLNNKNNSISLTFYDLGGCEREKLNEVIASSIEEYKSKGYKVHNDYTLTSNGLSAKIKQFIVKRINKWLNIYYLYVNKHVIKIESVLNIKENDIDYNTLINSVNYNKDIDIIMSIKEIDDGVGVNHEYNMSTLIPNLENINKVIDCFHSYFEKFNSLLLERSHELNLEKTYSTGLGVYILFNDYEIQSFNNYKEYKESFKETELNDVKTIEIELNLCYMRDGVIHNNEFKLTVRPYNIKFTRKSTYDENAINIMETYIYKYINELSKEKTVFNRNEN